MIADGDLVKSVRFESRIYIGDPINSLRLFNEMEADELLILDIDAGKGDGPNLHLLESLAEEAFMPLSYGGGLASLQDARSVFELGFEKLAFDAAVHNSPAEVSAVVDTYGAQAVTAIVTTIRTTHGVNVVAPDSRTVSLHDHLSLCESVGVGEILLYSRDRDGTRCGYDTESIVEASSKVTLPIVPCGGAGNFSHLAAALRAGASAVAAGSLFCFYGESQEVLISYVDDGQILALSRSLDSPGVG